MTQIRSHALSITTLLASTMLLACHDAAPDDLAADSDDDPRADAVDGPAERIDTRKAGPATLQRVALADGRYTVVDPEALPIGARERQGALTWEYVGPHAFRDSEAPRPPTRFQRGKAVVERSLEEQLRKTVRVDHRGRQWRIADIDAAALAAEAQHGHTHEPHDDRATPESYPAVEEDGWVTPLAWGRHDCLPASAPDGTDDQFLSDNSENRVDITAPSGRQRKAVIVDLDDSIFGGGSACSGVLVDEEFVLTAAHCVTNSIGGVAWPDVVCPLGNNDDYTNDTVLCQAISSVTISPDWSPGENVEDDYALLELITPVNPAMDPMGEEWGFMQLCAASDSTIDDDTSYFLGYPRVVGGGGDACNSIFNWTTLNTADNISACAQELLRSDGSVTGWTAGRIKTDHDYSWGSSGGPIYVCHGGTCDAGDTEHLTGLVVAHVNPAIGSAYNGGPKVEKFRAWAQAILPSQ